MVSSLIWKCSLASLVIASSAFARGDSPAQPTTTDAPETETPTVDLFDAARAGTVAVEAYGNGNEQMTMKVTNQTNKKLRVVLPPGLVASGATGQFGGMGGGMGGMGGGMGGMGGGMGGMGGGGGMGGMGGGGMRMLTLPATMGMMMLGRLIMTLVEPTESWNPASLMSGMSGMMGGGMGGMGGGMGGMGGGMGGMGGGMGGGFRSVPPTDLPNATLAPNQTRDLKTRIVSLRVPPADGQINYPEPGERLEISDISQIDADPRIQAALRRLSRDKASSTVSQMVLWAAAGMNWADVARMARGWANDYEVALAKQMLEGLDLKQTGDSGRLLVEVTARDESQTATSTALQTMLRNRVVLGLAVESTVPPKPTGPSVACKVQVQGSTDKPEVLVQLATTDATGQKWVPTGKFTLPLTRTEAGKVDEAAFGDALAEGLLNRLVKVTVSHPSAASAGLIPKTPKERDKDAYRVRIDNYSPLMLNGIALIGADAKPSDTLKILAGISLAPRKSLAVPVSAQAARDYGLRNGVKVMALDLSGL